MPISIGSSAVPGNAAASSQGADNTSLSGNDFLTLLVAQFQDQDPFMPQDPTQSVAQLAALTQVSTLEDISATLKRIEASQEAAAAVDGASASGDGVVSGS